MSGAGESNRVVEAAGLTKVFSDFWLRARAVAVDAIDFHIGQHEIFGLLGPNGSGKSTTIKMILGLLRPTRGRLQVLGHQPDDVRVKARIGYLPEESYLYRFLNPMETLDYYGKLFGLERRLRRRRCEELLEMVGLHQVGHRPVGEFSKGMARRLGLAQALINDPEFLILDEPTSGLDPIGTRQVKDLLVELGRRGKTILLSSHLLADVEDVCHRMVVLYGGRIRAAGTGESLLQDTDRTVIETRRLPTEVVEHVRRALAADGVQLDSVHAPRQRLEDLFMRIVEQARAEQATTSGALHGGKVAQFLAAESEGAGLVDSLVQAPKTQAPAATVQAPAAVSEPAKPDLSALVEPQEPARKPQAPRTVAPEAPKGPVDRGLLDRLVDGDEGGRT